MIFLLMRLFLLLLFYMTYKFEIFRNITDQHKTLHVKCMFIQTNVYLYTNYSVSFLDSLQNAHMYT